MVNKGKLKMALAAERGTDFKKIKEKRKVKEAQRRKRASETAKKTTDKKRKGEVLEVADQEEEYDSEGDSDFQAVDEDESEGDSEAQGEESEDDEEESGEEEGGVDIDALDDSASDSEVEMEKPLPSKTKSKIEAKPSKTAENEGSDEDEEDEDEDENEEDDSDIPMSDLEEIPDEDREDLRPHQRLTINNTAALTAALNRIALPTGKSATFASHMCVVSSGEPTAAGIEDIQDDLKRELAFYAQAQAAAKTARALLRKEGVPFTRPGDYFAEMVKDDGHMEKVKAKLVEEATNKKAAAEARRLRDLKKFGKQVQVAKMQERAKQKRETLEKIQALKKKRSETSNSLGDREAELFDVAVDNELSRPSKKRGPPGSDGKPNIKRQKKDQKYGFGGKKKFSKSGDAISSGDLSGFSAKKMKAGAKAQRPGKARRKAMAGKR